PVIGDSGAAGVSASSGAGPLGLAVASSPQSAGGDFTAASLSPAYSWAAGGSSGSFTYSYPLKVPASLGGPAPQLSLGYDSGAVDGQTIMQNGQSSWAGGGWDLQTGFIERSYRPCRQDGTNTGDLCWFSDNATMVWGGRSTRLVHVDGADRSVYRAADDSGLR